jgi:hypothetical protein
MAERAGGVGAPSDGARTIHGSRLGRTIDIGQRCSDHACAHGRCHLSWRRSYTGRSERIGGRLSKLCGGGGEDVYHSSV